MKRILLFILPPILITILFLVVVVVVSKDSGKGALQVTSNPSSKVYLNDQYIGDTPLCRCELPQMIKAGDYTVKLIPKEQNFDTFQEQIKISPSVLTVVDRTFGKGGNASGSIISLSPLDDKKASNLLVTSFPNRADIFIDEAKSGQTPASITNVTPSDHALRISKLGYKDKTLRIRTVLGYELSALVFLGINLESSKSAVASPSATPSVQKVVILNTPTGFLRVRSEASLTASVSAQVSPKEEYDLLDQKAGWYQIRLKDGKTGWISSQYGQIKAQ